MDRMNDQIVVYLKDESGILSRMALCVDGLEDIGYCFDSNDSSDSGRLLGPRSIPSYLSSDKAIPMYSSGAEYLAIVGRVNELEEVKRLENQEMKGW